MKKSVSSIVWSACALGLLTASYAAAQPTLLAVGTLDQSAAGSFADLSRLKYPLENGAPANLLGGLGSAIAYANGNTFLALPDRGPNAVTFDPAIDNTASYVNRFHTITMDLEANTSGALLPPYNLNLPYKLTPTLRATTLLWSLTLWYMAPEPASEWVPERRRSTTSCSIFLLGAPTISIPARIPAAQRMPASTQKECASLMTG